MNTSPMKSAQDNPDQARERSPMPGPRRAARMPPCSSLRRTGSFAVALTLAAWTCGYATSASGQEDPAPTTGLRWTTVANGNDPVPGPGAGNTFNSFNQPSVNARGLVVFRGRSRGGPPGGEPQSGIFLRDMGERAADIHPLFSKSEPVPYPNNVALPPDQHPAQFIEFPSIPRIGIRSAAVATRGNHDPVWNYTLPDGSDTRAGTTGIYVTLDGRGNGAEVLTGASKLGAVPEFPFYAVPGVGGDATAFDVFPGAPAVTDDNKIVFKGNYLDGTPKTGVFYRELANAEMGGEANYVTLIANSDTPVPNPGECAPGTSFGSTAPPSAALDRRGSPHAVFVGLDDEADPLCGGIYRAPLSPAPTLETLVGLDDDVPGEAAGTRFGRFGEGLSYDGRFLAFWAAWGDATRTLRLYCPADGSQARRDYCNNTGEYLGEGDPNSVCEPGAERCYQDVQVPVDQGMFVLDTRTGELLRLARTGEDISDFLYWVYSGLVPGTAPGGEEDDEIPRWRSSAFAAVSSRGGRYRVAFKASSGEPSPTDTLYLARPPGEPTLLTLLNTRTPGPLLDSQAPEDSVLTSLALERDGFRGRWLVISAGMGVPGAEEEEEAALAGLYITRVP
ncbi:hypothetical protein E4634_06505 [Mangrovimicrobium sediminis]|uniref:Uncharacterized protein n=1 Tax=Mangrovimicrobium sediminis TaxID=2562682 RepID=A0A4Z0M5B1_9GAMM|nr:hypothetical protein [Haliea sp. SAOS-164]TGD74842.1 hypothetical protein E4634_06505 [Haliea sp. SAOS-164]